MVAEEIVNLLQIFFTWSVIYDIHSIVNFIYIVSDFSSQTFQVYK